MAIWQGMVLETREGMYYVGWQLKEGPFSVPVAGVGKGSTTEATRKLLVRAREKLRLEVMVRAISLHPDQRGAEVTSWKERDNLSSAFLLSTPSPKYGLSSPIVAEALATMLCLPSHVCADKVGEKVDRFGVRVILCCE